MRISIPGLIRRLDSLRERINDLLDNLDNLEEIEIEDVQQYFQNDDTFNLAITTDVLEQADKLDEVLEIIKTKCYKNCNLALVNDSYKYETYLDQFHYFVKKYSEECGAFEIYEEDRLAQEEYDLLKEVLKCVKD